MVNQQPRHVVRSRVIGVMIRNAPNVKMYIVSVLWSDESEVIVYRSFQEFKKFHGHLKKRFPHLNALKKSERVIPKFRAGAIKSKLQQSGSRRSVHRMKFLDGYCSDLLNCDPSVCQSSEVTQFFTCKGHDLQPDFTKNSIMVLPSGDPSSDMADITRGHAGSITHPFMTQRYSCVAPYETKDTKNRPFSVALDEVLEVLIKDPAGWWLVENEHKRLAWFPAPYLQMLEDDINEADDEDLEDALPEGNALYRAVRTYCSKEADEVSVPIGSVVSVLRMSKDGWWLVRYNGKAGYIPSMYLKPYSNPQACLQSLQRKLYSPTLNLASLVPGETQATGERRLPSLSEQRELGGGSPGLRAAPRLYKAHSLDMLSTADRPSGVDGARPGSNGGLAGQAEPPLRRPRGYSTPTVASGYSTIDSRLSYRSSTSTSSSSRSSGSAQGVPWVAPVVPPRPKAQEILERCTTMTRKAALASRDRLVSEPAIHIQSR
ncbi:unnamed protein product [Merluccius merluccius]